MKTKTRLRSLTGNDANMSYLNLLFDWRESCFLIGLNFRQYSLCLPEDGPKLAYMLLQDQNHLKLVSPG